MSMLVMPKQNVDFGRKIAVRVPVEVWEALVKRATENSTTVSVEIRNLLISILPKELK